MGRAPRAGAALLVTMIVAAVVLQASVARAASTTTPPVAATLPVRATNWNDTVTLPRFNPALGELQAVHLEIDARLDGTIAVENEGSSPATDIQARAAAAVSVSRPGGAAAAAIVLGVTRSHDLAEFDGDVDYAGASGDSHDVNATGTTTTTLTEAADLLLFTGLTAITLPTSGTDVSTSDPGVTAVIDTSVGATVSVSYSYVTDERPPDPPTIESSPNAFTADADPTITFTHESGATASCQLTSPASTGPWSTCTSPWQGHLGPTGDGAYTFAVRATDAAGNVGEAATRSFTLDRIAPAAPVVSFSLLGPIPLLGRWSFSIEPGATARCSLDGAAPAPCTSPVTVDLGPLLDGDHTLTVVAVDAAGNSGPPASSTHHLDRVAPVPPTITGHPTSPGNDPTPTWTFDLAADAVTATCSIAGAAPVACSSPFTANLASAADGVHTLAVRNADSAGNPSGPATSAYTLDRALPGAPTITGPPSPSNDITPQWTIVAEEGATTQCRLDAGAWAACQGSFTTTFGPGSDGVHVLTVRAVDAAGNVGPEATSTFSLDATPPPAPTFLTAPADPSNDPQPRWTFTIESGSHAACSLDGGSWAPCSSPHQADLSAAADGPHTLAVRATDAYGNTGPSAWRGFVLDRTAPTAPAITSSPASPGSSATITFAFSTPPGTTTRCRVDLAAVFDCIDSVTVTLDADGEHRFAVAAVDAAGNQSSPAEAFYTLDRLAPEAPTITDWPASPSRVTTPGWSFMLEDGSTGECRVDGDAWSPCSTSFTADLSAAADGSHTFEVRATDAAGNVGEPATAEFVLDQTPPGAPVVTSSPDAHTDDDTPTWTFTVDADAAAECRLDDGPWLPCDGTFTPDLSGAPDGIHSLEVRAIDAVGNEGPTTVTAFELDRVAAAVASFTATPVTPGNDTTPEWAFTYEPGTTAWCSLDGGPAAACDGAFASELLADGTHELTVTVIDAAGNVSQPATSTLELDTVAPEAPSVTAPTTPDRDQSPEWLIELEPGAVAECSLDGAEAAACATVFTADLTGLDGSHELVVIARDAAGNASAATSSTYVLDTVAPAAPVILHTPDAAAWNWRFSIEAGATAECSVNGVPWATCASPMPGGISDRTVRFDVRAVDRAGNRSPVTSLTTTPTRGGAVGPPPAPPAAPPPTPHRTAVPGPRALTTPEPEPESEPGSPARLPGRTLLPELPIQVDAASILRPMREDGLFAGPVRDLLEAAAETTTIPVLVVMVVLAFVAVQNRIDRQDPKLADAPIRHEPEYLEFD